MKSMKNKVLVLIAVLVFVSGRPHFYAGPAESARQANRASWILRHRLFHQSVSAHTHATRGCRPLLALRKLTSSRQHSACTIRWQGARGLPGS